MSWGANLAIEILEEFAATIEPVREWRERLFEERRERYLEDARERARENAKLPHVKKRRQEYLATYQLEYRQRPEAIEARRKRSVGAKAKATRRAYESLPHVRERINRLTALRKAKRKKQQS